MVTTIDLEQLNAVFETTSTRDIIVWAVETFRPNVAMSSSFQTQSLPLLHIVSQTAPELPIIFLDTEYHFPETLAFRDRIVEEFGLTLRVVRATVSRDEFVTRYGDDLYRHDPDTCCYINKVEPMQRASEGLDAWISGIRRDQSSARVNTQILERTSQGVVRVHPMATWTRRDVWRYIDEHDLPEHPLLAQGYLSVGCAPCTRPTGATGDERAGRWADREKTECGLHTILREQTVESQAKDRHE